MKLTLVPDTELALTIARPLERHEIGTPEFNDVVAELARLMLENNGAAIAAPQAGIPWRLVIVAVGLDYEVLVNPEIETPDYGVSIVDSTEGCLSFPNELAHVWRLSQVHLKYVDRDKHKREVRGINGFAARVLQHEVDHLNGITMFDREETGVWKLS